MIKSEDVRHIAKLARLSLDENEVAGFTDQMGRILGFFDELAAIDTTDVPLTAHPLPVSDAYRVDEVRSSLGADAILAAAPHREDAYFRVPKILEA